MAAIPLNRFRTITHTLDTSTVGIYTCPPGVAALVIYGNVANTGSGTSVTQFTVSHNRGAVTTPIVAGYRIPSEDAANFIDGRLALETGDILQIKGNQNNTMQCIISVLENAK
tara:strand:+ start:98 stop:436 length:339 start_codon:yes stop_codon:yes gene_type:complete